MIHNQRYVYWASDPALKERRCQQMRPLHEHLAASAKAFWIAEDDGKPVGYVRSISRAGAGELAEFFVQPGVQSSGAPHMLLA